MPNPRDLWEGLLNLVFPGEPGCPVCGAGDEALLCPACREAMGALSGKPHCDRCGRFTGTAAPVHYCPECRSTRWPFERCRAYGPYDGVLRDAVHSLKYGRRRELARPLGELMARTVHPQEAYRTADFLVPVPLTGEAFKRRGFNQAALLADSVGRELGLPVRPVLAKVRNTPAQAGLSRAARLKNLAGSFAVTGGTGIIRDRTVVLVDDVFTTGSTLSEAARVLRKVGAARVLGLVFVAGRN
ncbi:MAG: ComF family protein [Candidatus Desulforudis sp.]|nr:ComF family protein [Desulforudis sp.]